MAIQGISGINSGYQINPVSQMDVKPVEDVFVSSEVNEVAAASQDTNLTDKSGSGKTDDTEKKGFSDESVGQDLNDIKKRLGSTECKFGIDEATNRITIKIVDKETKEIIKEVPPEKTLKMIAKVWEMAGILVDEKL